MSKVRGVKQIANLMMLSGETQQERELVFFGKLAEDGVERLRQIASKIEHMVQHQWLFDNTAVGGVKGQVRARAIQIDNEEPKYIMTTKVYRGPGDATESEIEIPVEMFDAIERMAPEGQAKTRYTVESPDGLAWEVDVIYTRDHQVVEWAKIDIEIPAEASLSENPSVPETLNGVFVQMIDRPYAERTDEENAILDDLFKNKFFIKNDKVVTSKLPEGFERFVDPKVVIEMLMPAIEPLVNMIPALSYNEKYFDFDEEGQLKSALQELKHAALGVLRLSKKNNEECDCDQDKNGENE